ncbi:hypothetical protein Avbf_12333, partial [Armadillidium vulgare]
MDITAEVTKRKDIILKKEARMALSFEVFDKCLAKLEKLTRILNEVDEDLKKTDDVVRCDDLKKSMSFLLSNFENSKEYLLEIYKRVQNGEKVFTVRKIEDEIKYGEVSKYENKLFFHSLSLSEVPTNSSLIWFEELKQCANVVNFYTFIEICCNKNNLTHRIIIRMFDKQMSNYFIRLCTGENGPSYKGASFRKDVKMDNFENILRVRNFIENGGECNRVIDYSFCIEHEMLYYCYVNEMVVCMYGRGNGNFGLFSSSETIETCRQIVGR